MRWCFLIILSIVVIVFFDKKPVQNSFDAQLLTRTELIATQVSPKLMSNRHQNGKVVFANSEQELSEWQIQQSVADKKKQDQARPLLWGRNNQVTMSAMGLDWKHHFASSFLVGIRPFAVENNWLPLYTLSKRKTYQLDNEQYGALDLWQNSAQAFVMLRGDCEDHAIALADWLISEGVDARVAVGLYKTNGHAWVVAKKNNKMYVLEATNKRSGKAWNHYPLASVSRHYHPQYMFNRDSFWVNTASSNTTDYLGAHWQKSSEFVRYKMPKIH
ncbi:hypothetical protein [Thalassotalea sp. PLHSN55]|uniref:hypothetical protein n=1 Tax=Thalassotalea sp. PLHSN55 TaxID=3435888 RepID=UPI003F833E45